MDGKVKEEGHYKSGKEHGKWTYWREDGTVETSYDIHGNLLTKVVEE